ncbi:DUF2795 domain-containing protein [Candidatus Microgenomates bacterium]|nr:DUF2795 domain-containing protein [Candidatus Microgenomates bacterium]
MVIGDDLIHQDAVTKTRQFLAALDYPATKRQLISQAELIGDSEMLRRVRRLPPEQYLDAEDLEQALAENLTS